jgi:hypothetical protein
VLADINESYYRVDYYNSTSGLYQHYIPNATFGNNLDRLTTDKAYWIWMYYDDVLFIT